MPASSGTPCSRLGPAPDVSRGAPKRWRNVAGVVTSMVPRGDGFTITPPRGTIEVTTPATFLHRFGAPRETSGAGTPKRWRNVADPSLLQGVPEEAGMGGLYAGNATVIARQDAMGAVLV